MRLLASETPTNLGILQEPGHDEPLIIAMNCPPTRAAVRDYGNRWGIEPLFSDLKSRDFHLNATQLRAPDRLDHLLLMMALALYWCVRAGQEDADDHPTPLEKNSRTKRFEPLDLSKTRPQCSLVVQARFTVAPKVTPN